MGDADRGPTVTDEEILAAVANAGEEEPRTEQVADDLPISTDRLRDRLEDLREVDLVDLSDDDLPGDRWRLGSEADEELLPEQEVETEVEAQATKVTGAESLPRDEETPESPPPDPGEDPVEPGDSPPEERDPEDVEPADHDPEAPRDDAEEDPTEESGIPDEVPPEDVDE